VDRRCSVLVSRSPKVRDLKRLCSTATVVEDVRVISQLIVLAGVIVGALASYLTTAAIERARWRRARDSRWDDRRVEAYASYAETVKEIIRISSRLAAGQGITSSGMTPLVPSPENLDLLDAAAAARTTAWEKVLLLGAADTVTAARSWHESVCQRRSNFDPVEPARIVFR
jgi:hypothetical protein